MALGLKDFAVENHAIGSITLNLDFAVDFAFVVEFDVALGLKISP